EPLRRSFPVAPLALRMAALLKDAQYVAGAILFFLAGLSSARLLDTSLTPSPLLLGSAVCGSLVVILLFGLVFVWGAATTPGMKSAGLCLVSFDGRPAPRRQRLWRVLGGIVSAGSFFIGYLWALADEETLYWHDHISKTYLALSAALPANEHR
ncbi:MAG TPA: RDD family protein, partial [Terriglobia bacterium]|nr:RDD family protein [Terriglobia bacterium]